MSASCPEETDEEDGAEDAAVLEFGFEETTCDDTSEEAVANGELQPEAAQRRNARQSAILLFFFLFIVVPQGTSVGVFTGKEPFCIPGTCFRLIRIRRFRPA